MIKTKGVLLNMYNNGDDSIYKKMAADISNSNDISEDEKTKLLKNITRLKENKINLMIVGATGVGKSSTINALFGEEVSKVGRSPDPETQKIEKYDLGNLILWDTPGLGDSEEADKRYATFIRKKLTENDVHGKPLIDLVLVLTEGGSKGLETTYNLINKIIIPALGGTNEKCKNRILLAINQCDLAMKSRGWNHEKNCPEPKLKAFLEEKVVSVHNRIKEDTGVDIEPIYYSAAAGEDEIPYNLSKLLYLIIKYTPKEKRVIYADQINHDPTARQYDDGEDNYNGKSAALILESIKDGAVEGADAGSDIGSDIGSNIGKTVGSLFGSVGEEIGELVGGAIGSLSGNAIGGFVGGAVGFVKGLFGL